MTFLEVVTWLGIIAGALISLGVIWDKGIKPLYQMIKKMDKIYERVETLPEWCATVDASLAETQKMMAEHLESHDRINSGVS